MKKKKDKDKQRDEGNPDRSDEGNEATLEDLVMAAVKRY